MTGGGNHNGEDARSELVFGWESCTDENTKQHGQDQRTIQSEFERKTQHQLLCEGTHRRLICVFIPMSCPRWFFGTRADNSNPLSNQDQIKLQLWKSSAFFCPSITMEIGHQQILPVLDYPFRQF